MEKWVKWNTGIAVDTTGIIAGTLLIICVIKANTKLVLPLCIFIILFAIAIYLYAHTDTWLINLSNNSVFIKPEERGDVMEVKPGKSIYGLDGVKTKVGVYKITDGIHAIVCKSGRVWELSLSSFVLDLAHGGMLEAPPDAGWQKLFDK